MLRKLCLTTCGLALLLTGLPASGYSDEISEKGRTIFQKYQHVVVTVQIVIKSTFSMGGRGGQSTDIRQDLTGTVLDPSGLTVLSLSATDPGQMVKNMMSGEDESKFKMETELSDLKILSQDGSEIPAEVILRDKDLDLAFIRPKTKPAAPMEALDLSNAAKAEVLDQVISLNRLGNAAGRSYAASVERISAIVQRPRLYYIPETGVTTTALGSPAFTIDGKPLGIFVMRSTRDRSGGAGGFSVQPSNLTGIIVPAADVLKAAKQVPEEAQDKEKK